MTLKIVVYNHYNVDANHFNSWLQSVITPGIEEITLLLPTNYRDGYNFPCSMAVETHSVSSPHLCAFRPTVGFDCLRRLTKLHLYQVCITGNELGCLISKSFALEQLELMYCDELICLKIPLCLERLSCLRVTWCKMLKVIESTGPNLSSFDLFGDPIQLSLGESSQLKNLHVGFSYHDNFVSYSITRLPSIHCATSGNSYDIFDW